MQYVKLSEVLRFFETENARRLRDVLNEFTGTGLSDNQLAIMVRGLAYVDLITAYGSESATRYVLSDLGKQVLDGLQD